VGVPGEDYQESGPDAGVVFVFMGSPEGLADPALIHQNPHGDNEASDLFGTALAAGDFNGDGFDDLAISATEAAFEDFGANAGWILVANGSPEGLGDSYFLDQEPAGAIEAEDRFGSSMAVGDFNADGFADLAAGAPGEDYQDSGPDAGVVFVFSGGSNGLGEPYIIDQNPLGANEAGDAFGTALASGDFNGDGSDDLAISAMEAAYEDYGANAGWIYIANGSSDGLGDSYFIDQSPAGDNEAEDAFGASLAAGDFNGDGIDDLASGAPGEDYGGSGPGTGVAFLLTGSTEGLGSPSFIHQEPYGSNESGDHFGSVLAAGDFNGDGLDELAIGTPNETYEDVGTNVGWVLIACAQP
jgi:sulfur relay (sulfurtransferase) DsrF/TusC family protein